MNRNSNNNTKEITYIAIGVATIIVGSAVIFQLSLAVPIPGIKYILMAPYLSMMIYIFLSKIKRRNALLKIGLVFGLIMIIINLYMGITIIITAILSQVSVLGFKDRQVPFWGAIIFAGYSGFCALTVSKYVVGGVFASISIQWLFLTGIICLTFGALGTILAKKVLKHLMNYSYKT